MARYFIRMGPKDTKFGFQAAGQLVAGGASSNPTAVLLGGTGSLQAGGASVGQSGTGMQAAALFRPSPLAIARSALTVSATSQVGTSGQALAIDPTWITIPPPDPAFQFGTASTHSYLLDVQNFNSSLHEFQIKTGGTALAAEGITAALTSGLSYDGVGAIGSVTGVVLTLADRWPYTNAFAATETPLRDGGRWRAGASDGLDWTNVNTGLASDGVTRVAYPTQVGHNGAPFDDSIACVSGGPANQFIQATMYEGGVTVGEGNPEVELLLRFNIGSHTAAGLEVDIVHDGRVFLTQWLGAQGSFNQNPTEFRTNVSITNGAVWYAQITGTGTGAVVVVRCNGLQVLSQSLASLGFTAMNSGSPGIGFWTAGLSSQTVQANRKFAWKNVTIGIL